MTRFLSAVAITIGIALLSCPGAQAAGKNPELSQLVATINAKLARWVHPTGKCGGASELLATYYWQGKRTATGERFDKNGMTAASRTLPFGTTLYIRNPHNDRAVTVRINDRGPFTHAKLDLSLGAAQQLGLKQSSYVCVSGGAYARE